MAYQFEAGPYDKIDITDRAEGEGAVITEDNPTTASGKALYICMEGGEAVRVLTAEDILDGWKVRYLKPADFDAETGQPTLSDPNEETVYYTLVGGNWKRWTFSGGEWTAINDNEITGANLADNCVNANNLIDGCVTGSKVAAGAIDSSKLSQSLRDSITRISFTNVSNLTFGVASQGKYFEIKATSEDYVTQFYVNQTECCFRRMTRATGEWEVLRKF